MSRVRCSESTLAFGLVLSTGRLCTSGSPEVVQHSFLQGGGRVGYCFHVPSKLETAVRTGGENGKSVTKSAGPGRAVVPFLMLS